MAGVGAAVKAALPVAPPLTKTVAPPASATTNSHDSRDSRESDAHNAFEEANFSVSDEDDIPFDFNNSKPAGPQDHHDAPF